MAQRQLLQQQRGFSELLVYQQRFSRSQLGLDYPISASAPAQQGGEYTQTYVMAQPLLQDQYRPEDFAQNSHWSAPQQLSQDFQPPVSTALDHTANGFGYPSGQLWEGTTALNDSAVWTNAMQMEPYIVRDIDNQVRQNCELVYDGEVASDMPVKGHADYGRQPIWVPLLPHGLPRGMGMNGSDMERSNSLSPKSPFSERLDDTYSPGSMPDTASPKGTWSSCRVALMPYPESSPQCVSARAHMNSARTYTAQGPVPFHLTDLSKTRYDVTPSSTAPARTCRQDHGAISLDTYQHTFSEHSYPQGNSSDSSPWYPSERMDYVSSLPFRPREPQAQQAHMNSDTSDSSANGDGSSDYPVLVRESSRNDGHAQVNYQPRFQVPRSIDAEAQRKSNDEVLVQGKRSGLTYKEIRNKMVGEKPAESTLRGRYRSLTKARKDRVRKPVWKKNDAELLNQFVERELDRIESSLSNPRALTIHQKLVKVRWKEVAEYINNHGGSYRFGNSTCKKEWLKRNPDTK